MRDFFGNCSGKKIISCRAQRNLAKMKNEGKNSTIFALKTCFVRRKNQFQCFWIWTATWRFFWYLSWFWWIRHCVLRKDLWAMLWSTARKMESNTNRERKFQQTILASIVSVLVMVKRFALLQEVNVGHGIYPLKMSDKWIMEYSYYC